MEVEVKSKKSRVKNTAWLNPYHPNFERWKRARDLSIVRGYFVKSIVDQYLDCKNLSVLDLGSGEGGTSIIFSGQNKVTSYDFNLIRLERQKVISNNIFTINGDALKLSFKDSSFDLIILQDVIEHLPDIAILIKELKRVVKSGGIIYLSTPNKYSIYNFIADPHWGFPFVSILKRESIKKYFLNYFRKNEVDRKDIPQLLSLKDVCKYFGNYFEINLETKHSVNRLFSGDKGIAWSNFHLSIINFIRKIKLKKMLLLVSNNRFGIINKFFTPTFYLIMRKIK